MSDFGKRALSKVKPTEGDWLKWAVDEHNRQIRVAEDVLKRNGLWSVYLQELSDDRKPGR